MKGGFTVTLAKNIEAINMTNSTTNILHELKFGNKVIDRTVQVLLTLILSLSQNIKIH
jgi:hypothetical protein